MPSTDSVSDRSERIYTIAILKGFCHSTTSSGCSLCSATRKTKEKSWKHELSDTQGSSFKASFAKSDNSSFYYNKKYMVRVLHVLLSVFLSNERMMMVIVGIIQCEQRIHNVVYRL